jgi:hypothetical protein
LLITPAIGRLRNRASALFNAAEGSDPNKIPDTTTARVKETLLGIL